MVNYSIQVSRHNVTLAQFLGEVKNSCKRKGIPFDLDRDEFENPSRPCNTRYHVKDGVKVCYSGNRRYELDGSDAAAQVEVVRLLPLDMQTFVLNFDGSLYNEIAEFTLDGVKKGFGYYYQENRDGLLRD
jgi:hypothetical protein